MAARILVFAGSVRSNAYSGKVADAAMKELAQQGAEVARLSLADYPLPIMDEDHERERGIPESAVQLARQIAGHDAVLICTPEYNGSVPPLLKNAIDWVSRVKSDGSRALRPYPGKVVGVCSSSNGHFAGIRAANHLRAILAHIGMEVVSAQVSVPNAADAFDADGAFRDERLSKGMKRLCESLVEHARAFSIRTAP